MDDDATAAMSLASLSGCDVENRANADNDDQASTLDELEELTLEAFADEETVEMPSVDDDDKTRKMPRRDAKTG
jgi:hypothetical protein